MKIVDDIKKKRKMKIDYFMEINYVIEDFVLKKKRFEKMMNLDVDDNFLVEFNYNIKELNHVIHDFNRVAVAGQLPIKASFYDKNIMMIQHTGYYDESNYRTIKTVEKSGGAFTEQPTKQLIKRVTRWLTQNGYNK